MDNFPVGIDSNLYLHLQDYKYKARGETNG